MRASSQSPAKSHFSEMNEFCLSTWMRPKRVVALALNKNPSVARVTASAGLLDGRGLVAIQGQRKLQAFRLLAKQRENSGVAPLGKNHVGVFALEQSRKSKRRRLACFVEFPASPIHFDFERGAATMRGIDAR